MIMIAKEMNTTLVTVNCQMCNYPIAHNRTNQLLRFNVCMVPFVICCFNVSLVVGSKYFSFSIDSYANFINCRWDWETERYYLLCQEGSFRILCRIVDEIGF